MRFLSVFFVCSIECESIRWPHFVQAMARNMRNARILHEKTPHISYPQVTGKGRTELQTCDLHLLGVDTNQRTAKRSLMIKYPTDSSLAPLRAHYRNNGTERLLGISTSIPKELCASFRLVPRTCVRFRQLKRGLSRFYPEGSHNPKTYVSERLVLV